MTMLQHKTSDYTVTPARPRLAGVFAGTKILTARGELAIEDLRVGDRIVSRDRGMVVLRALTRRCVTQINAIQIRPDSLGIGRPDRDVMVAPGQHLYLRDWRAEALFGAEAALVPAYRLIDGNYVKETAIEDALMFELHFDGEHIIYANGMELGTGATADALLHNAA